jgi:pyruvate formate lyase activating enzyme
MIIKGLQRLSTIDFLPYRACTVFTYGCNFRCGFCHNPELVTGTGGERYPENFVFNFLNQRIRLLEGVCISGGEPTMQTDLELFIQKVKEMGFAVKLDTNGSKPSVLQDLLRDKLVDYVAMDVKGSRELYPIITGRENVDLKAVEKGMGVVSEFSGYEFRTTVVPRYHTPEAIEEMAKWMNSVCGGKPKKYFLQGFKNQGKFVGPSFANEREVTEEYLIKLKKIAEPYFEKVEIRV